MSYKEVLVVSDNERILNFFMDTLDSQQNLKEDREFRFVCSPRDTELLGKKLGNFIIAGMDIKEEYEEVIRNHDLVISAHCKQIFPTKLTESTKCINIHPGLNPFNRGWYPQVFSILNGLPLGATIHEIDSEIDHGAIIDQIEVELNAWDTSLDAYNRVQDAERILLERSLGSILNGTYTTTPPHEEGNLNLQKDFEALREIDLGETVTYEEAINRLRALTHGNFKNGYFIDRHTNKKIYIRVSLEPEDD